MLNSYCLQRAEAVSTAFRNEQIFVSCLELVYYVHKRQHLNWRNIRTKLGFHSEPLFKFTSVVDLHSQLFVRLFLLTIGQLSDCSNIYFQAHIRPKNRNTQSVYRGRTYCACAVNTALLAMQFRSHTLYNKRECASLPQIRFRYFIMILKTCRLKVSVLADSRITWLCELKSFTAGYAVLCFPKFLLTLGSLRLTLFIAL